VGRRRPKWAASEWDVGPLACNTGAYAAAAAAAAAATVESLAAASA